MDDKTFERIYRECKSIKSFGEILTETIHLQEMGQVTVSVGCEILFPLFNKGITSNPQEIREAVEKIYSYGMGGLPIFCNDDRITMGKEEWIENVFNRISEIKTQQMQADNSLIKEYFLSRRTQR